jgi:CheY-like chemotaxis protein
MGIIRQSEANSALAQEAQQRMERQLRHFVRLVEDLLDMNRITHGKLRLRIERAELGAILRDAVEMSRPLGEDMKREILLQLPAEPVHVDADPVRLTQVIGNLVNNACKYTESGGHIWIAMQPGPEAIRVSVRDDGIGIPADMLPSIFDLFVQVDATLDRSRGGLGIGLTLVKRLVELHRGRVEVFSDGRASGCEFVVHLPVPDEASDRPAADRPTAATEMTGFQKILVVDDDMDSAWSLASLLQIGGHQTHTVHDGIEAVLAADDYRPDVVIMDIGLPGISGYEAARRIRLQPWGKAVLLIAMSGWAQDEDRRRSFEAGFDAHLVKPVDLDVLTNLLGARKAGEPV